MNTKLTLAVLSAAALALAIGVAWQVRNDNVATIGILHPTSVDNATVVGFKEAMREFGYVENKSVRYVYEGPAGRGEALRQRARYLAEAEVDLIFSSSTPATKAAEAATRSLPVPIVFGPVNDPIGAGLVDSLKSPGGSVTGVTLPRNTAQRFAWFKELNPEIARVLVLYNPDDGSSVASLQRLETVDDQLGIELIVHPVREPDAVRAVLKDFPPTVQGLFLPRDAMITAMIPEIAATAIEAKIPLSVPGYLQVQSGALFSYGFVHHDIGRMTARLAHAILGGEPPANIPVETAESHLFINKNTADAIGLVISSETLAQAKTVVR